MAADENDTGQPSPDALRTRLSAAQQSVNGTEFLPLEEVAHLFAVSPEATRRVLRRHKSRMPEGSVVELRRDGKHRQLGLSAEGVVMMAFLLSSDVAQQASRAWVHRVVRQERLLWLFKTFAQQLDTGDGEQTPLDVALSVLREPG